MVTPSLPDWSPNVVLNGRFVLPAPLIAGAAFAVPGAFGLPAIANPLPGGAGPARPWAQRSANNNANSRGHLIANALAPRLVNNVRKRSTYLSGATFNFANVVPTYSQFDGQQWSSAETAVTSLLDECWHPLTAAGGVPLGNAVSVDFYYMAGPGREVYGGILNTPAEFARATGAAGFAAGAANLVAWPVTLWAILVARITPPGGGAAVTVGFGWRCLNVAAPAHGGCSVSDITTLTAAIGFDPLPSHAAAAWRTMPAGNEHHALLPNAAAHCNADAVCVAAVAALPADCRVGGGAANVKFDYPLGALPNFLRFHS
jgi:hypothetical protein